MAIDYIVAWVLLKRNASNLVMIDRFSFLVSNTKIQLDKFVS